VFKILALDGGGIRGAYTAAVIDEIQHKLKRPINDYFDLIVGTSTGGIIALGLANRMSSEEILAIYKDSDALKSILVSIFGHKKFVQSSEHVAITSFDAADASPVVFRSNYHESISTYGDLSVADVALATSAAPTYFSAAPAGSGFMIDGGVWANCPVMVGVTDALTHFQKPRKEIRILSIGTTSEPVFVDKGALDGGLFDWAKTAPSTIMHASKLAALNQARSIADTLIRIDTPVNKDRFLLDDSKAIDDLIQLGRSAANINFDEVKTKFMSRLARHRPTSADEQS